MEAQVAALAARMDLMEARSNTVQQEHTTVHANLVEHRALLERLNTSTLEQGRDLAGLKATRVQMEAAVSALDAKTN